MVMDNISVIYPSYTTPVKLTLSSGQEKPAATDAVVYRKDWVTSDSGVTASGTAVLQPASSGSIAGTMVHPGLHTQFVANINKGKQPVPSYHTHDIAIFNYRNLSKVLLG